MKKKALCLLLASMIATADTDFENYALENSSETLNARDHAMLQHLEDRTKLAPTGSAMRSGEVVFSYGSGHHSVVCAMLELCDIALEPGEHILGAQIGDAERWNVDTAVSGSAKGQIEHLVVKPHDSALKTSLMITTDRRTYHLSLKSSLHEYMPAVRFIYPDSKLNAYSSGRVPLSFNSSLSSSVLNGGTSTQASISSSTSKPRTSKGSISDFEIIGDDEICPTAVSYDGRVTIIEFKREGGRMPALMLKNPDGSMRTANYRLKGNSYVVDGLVNHAVLFLGSDGSSRQAEIKFLG